MAAPQYKLNVRRIKPLRPGDRTVSAKDHATLVDAVRAALSTSASGGVNAMLGPGGAFYRANVSASRGESWYAVVRSVGNGTEPYIQIQPVYTDDGSEWYINLRDQMEPVSCVPGYTSKWYSIFLFRGTEVNEDTPIVRVSKTNNIWIAEHTPVKWYSPTTEPVPLIRHTDCQPFKTRD